MNRNDTNRHPVNRYVRPSVELLGAALFLGAAFLSHQAFAAKGTPAFLQKLDPDGDGTVDLAEAKAAAGALFDKLDRDHDGTLDARELRGRLSGKEFTAADPDNDGTLTKDEYLAVVEKRFGDANTDNDGTLDLKELQSRAGRALVRLMM